MLPRRGALATTWTTNAAKPLWSWVKTSLPAQYRHLIVKRYLFKGPVSMDASTPQTAFSLSTYFLDNGKHEQYVLSNDSWSHFWDCCFFVMDRMSVLVYQVYHSKFCILCVFRGWESTPSAINHLPQQLHSTSLQLPWVIKFRTIITIRSREDLWIETVCQHSSVHDRTSVSWNCFNLLSIFAQNLFHFGRKFVRMIF